MTYREFVTGTMRRLAQRWREHHLDEPSEDMVMHLFEKAGDMAWRVLRDGKSEAQVLAEIVAEARGLPTPPRGDAPPRSGSGPPAGGLVLPCSDRSSRDALPQSLRRVDTGPFTFPAPWRTQGVRLTTDDEARWLEPVGYSYWRNINAHGGRDAMYVVLTLNRAKGGPGPCLFEVPKRTLAPRMVRPLFAPSHPLSWATGEGWYFCATDPRMLHVVKGRELARLNVETGTMQTVFMVGEDEHLWQCHSSADGRVHSGTVRKADGTAVAAATYDPDAGLRLWPTGPEYDECQVDASGHWLLIKANTDRRKGEDNVVIDLRTGARRVLLDEQGAAGHSDMGHGYMVAEDDHDARPNAVKRWDFATLRPSLVYHGTSWDAGAGHVSHTNVGSGRFACISNASASRGPRHNEIIQVPLDGSLRFRALAPSLVDMAASGGGDAYRKMPKGNLCPEGEWFVWTANHGTERLDAFMVRVPPW